MVVRRKGSAWTPGELKLLGTDSDAEIARRLGRTVKAIKLKRKESGIQAPLQPPWTDPEIKLLGTRPDREIARRTGRSFAAVQTKRLQLKIRNWRRRARKPAAPVEPEKVKLLFGPYHPPRARRGKFIFCERRGTVKVGDYSDGPIPWPMKWGTRSIVLCGELVRAVRQESGLAAAHHWGVCPGTVSKWRHAVEAGPLTPGTRRLKSYTASEAMTPALRSHLSRLKTGKPSPLTRRGRARLLAALRRPKTARWFKSMAQHFEARRGIPVDPNDRPWTPQQEQVLGTKPDRDVALELNRSVAAVIARRKLKAIPYVAPALRPWSRAEVAMLGKVPDHQIVARTGHPLKSVQSKRQELGLLVRPHPKPWTTNQERLLGKRPDTEVAVILRRERTDVRRRRVALGIPPAVERSAHRDWTAAEDKLLGTAPDAEIGRRLGRSLASVQLHRLGLGLPSHRQKNLRSI